MGHLDEGRILIGIEGAGGTPSGTSAFAIIDGAGFHPVSTDDWTMAHATWAPASGIVFDSERADDRHLFRMAEDGSGVSQVTRGFRVADQDGAFSLGDRLVYDHYGCAVPRDLGLQVAATDGSNPVDLTPDHPLGDPTSDFQATISPDGKTVVFVRGIDDNQTTGGLFSIPITGGAARRLTPDASGVSYPRWSPDGSSILFSQYTAAGDLALWSVPAVGGAARQVSKLGPGRWAFESDWSPNGAEIVFKSYQPGWDHNELHVMAADGSHDSVLWVGDRSTAESPDWGN